MRHAIPFQTGNDEALADEFLQAYQKDLLKFDIVKIENPCSLSTDDILGIHFADPGAQGDPGAVEILYFSQNGVQVLYGNFAYGDLDLDAVIQKLPMLQGLDSRDRYEYPYPFEGYLNIPPGWMYLYMGALNHLIVRKEIWDRTIPFIKNLMNRGHQWFFGYIFDAVAWYCGAKCTS